MYSNMTEAKFRIEVNVSIIVACIPTLRPLVKIFRHQINTGHSNHGWTRNRSVEPEEMNLGIDKPFPLQPVTGAAHTGALRTPPQPTTHPIEWSYSSKTNLVEGTRKAMEFAVYKNESHR